MSRDDLPPTGKLARAGRAGLVTARVGIVQAKHISRKPFTAANEKEAAQDRRDEEIGRTLFAALTQLRGTALKVSQALSAEAGLLPSAMRKELSRAHYSAPPINRAVIRKLLVTQLGRSPELLFSSFEPTAFAAASLGQVHRATVDGEQLCVKIQYPGIATSVRSDLGLLRGVISVLPSSSRIRGAEVVRPVIDEIEERLLEEVDYVLEASNTTWFGEHLDIEGVVIPKVIPDLCSRTVLTTTHVDGLHLDEWLATDPSQALRDQFGELLCHVFFRSCYQLRTVHADPHPGNFLFMADGRLGLIDFGCVKRFDEKTVHLIRGTVDGYLRDDLDEVIRIYQEMAILGADADDAQRARWREKMRPFQQWITRSLGADEFDFSASPDYVSQGRKAGMELGTIFTGMHRDMIYYERSIMGLFRMLERMGARIRFRDLLEATVSDGDPVQPVAQ